MPLSEHGPTPPIEAEITDADVQDAIGRQRWYWLLMLSEGPRRDQSDAEAADIQAAHLRHMFTLRRRGRLIMFGPVRDAGRLRGIGVVTVATREEAEALMAEDPAVLAGRLIVEVRPWFTMPGDRLPG